MARVEVDIIKMIINTYILKNPFHHWIYQQIAYIDNENGMIFEIWVMFVYFFLCDKKIYNK